MGTSLSIGNRAEVTTGSIVSANYFNASASSDSWTRIRNRAKTRGGTRIGDGDSVNQLWKGRFKSDPQIIRENPQRLNNVVHTIVGVAPEGFYGTFVGWAMQFWVPASMEENFEGGGYKLGRIAVLGGLKLTCG